MANLVAYRINDSLTDVVSVGEPPSINPPEDFGEYVIFWKDESNDTFYGVAINRYDLNTENLRIFLSEIYWKFLGEKWPYEKVKKKDFENIILKVWLPDDYSEYMDNELELEFEHIIQTKTKISRLFVNGVESKWKPSEVRTVEWSFTAFLILSFLSPFVLPFLLESVFEALANEFWSFCLGLFVFAPIFLLVVNIVNALGVILMRIFLPLDLIRFVFDLNATDPVYKKTNQISHWLASQVLFPGRKVSL